jgi:hypothetical protein
MKKTLLIITLFIGFGNVNAQDASNDATWGETIGFLKSNISKFDMTLIRFGTSDGYKGVTKESYEIKESVLERLTVSLSNTSINNETWKADLKELVSVGELSEKTQSLLLNFTKNSVLIDDFEYTQRQDLFSIVLCSKKNVVTNACDRYEWKKEDEFVQRMVKAFQHLAYLAKEKRKKSKF